MRGSLPKASGCASWGQTAGFSAPGSVNLGKLLPLSEPQFVFYKMGVMIVPNS